MTSARTATRQASTARRRLTQVAAVVATAVGFGLAAVPASAGGSHHGYYGQHAGGHGYYQDRRYRNSYRSHRRSYNRGYRHGSRYHRKRHRDRNTAYLVGGLVLGSVIANAVNHHRYTHRPAYSHREVIVRDRPTVVRTYSTPVSTERVGRRLFRDIDGNCFERLTDSNGDELLQELPAEACDW